MTEAARPTAPTQQGTIPASASTGTGSGTGGGGNFTGAVIVVNPTTELSKLVVGQTIDTTVLQSGGDGRTRLSLEGSDLLLYLKPSPAKGALIRLQVIATTPSLSLRLMGEHIATRQNAHPLPSIQAPPPGPVSTVISARFTASAPADLAQAGPHLMSANSPMQAYIANTVATAPATVAGPLPNHSAIAVRILPIAGNNAFDLTAKSAATGIRTLSGQVVSSPRGTTTVSTSVGFFTVERPLGLTEGAQVQLQLLSNTLRPTHAGTGRSTPILTATHLWETLQTALQAVAADPVSAPIVAQDLPAAGSRLATTLVFFISAMYGGRLQDWLSREAMDVLRARQPGILGQLSEAFSQLGRSAAEPVQGDWRLIYTPFLNGDEATHLRLFLRHQEQKPESGANGRGGVRFVLEAELSRLGLIQLDGLVRDRIFDLVVRSPRDLSAELQLDLQTIFSNAAVTTGFSGRLDFQATPVVLQAADERPSPDIAGIIA